MINYIDDNCIVYDAWVNTGQPTPINGGDYETIDQVKAAALTCRRPLRIECRTATGTPYSQTGQAVTCSLDRGLVCNNADQIDVHGCLDYKVRLGCLKSTPECGKSAFSTAPKS